MSSPLTEIFEQEYRELRPRAPIPPLDIRFRRFTSLNTTIRLREGNIHVSLSDLLEGAPESVLHAIAHILLAKLYKKPIDAAHSLRYKRFASSAAVTRQTELIRYARGTKRISGISGGFDLLPWSGPLFGIAILALCAMPPFGIFRSEFEIVQGGFSSARYATPAVLIVLVTLAFFGLTVAANRMLLVPARGRVAADLPRGEPSAWMVVPVVAGVAALLVLGVHPPAELTGLLSRAVHQLGAVT